MKIVGIEHIGIAVNDLETASSFWENILNILHVNKRKSFVLANLNCQKISRILLLDN